jgi:phosphate transport system protein
MPRETFDRELQKLQDSLLTLGSMVEQALRDSVTSLRKKDLDASRQIIAQDRVVNEMRFEIENGALILIATQQPMASDLRQIAAILENAIELERIGDYAKGIAKISLLIGAEPFVKPLVDIPRMAEKACDMLHRALRAFTDRNVDLAYCIPEEDDEVDNLYLQVYRELMTYIIADPKVIDQANYLLWAAHNLERAADRVTNICERTIFTVTGELFEIKSSDDETTLLASSSE